jgi:SAM-dependent methyltransferase
VGSMPEAYERWLTPVVFRPFAVDLARRVGALGPRRVLEVAAGTGVLTRELVSAGAEVTATDLNAAMVAFGSSRVPGAEWRQADVFHLPFADAEFDVVVCQFGVMFFPDKAAAFREMRRVLAPGGRLLFSTWGAIATHGFADAAMAGVVRAFPEDPPAFLVAVPHGYSDLGRVTGDLAGGGLECVSVETVTLEGRAESAAGLAAGFCTGTPLRLAIEARGDLTAATAVVAGAMAERLGDGPVSSSMTAYVVEARA